MLSRFWGLASVRSDTPQAGEQLYIGLDPASSPAYNNINIGGYARVTLGNVYGSHGSSTRPNPLPSSEKTHDPNHSYEDIHLDPHKSEEKVLYVKVLESYHRLLSLMNRRRPGTLGVQAVRQVRGATTFYTILQDSLHALLDPLEGSSTTRQMLVDAHHPKWSFDGLQAYLDTRFGIHKHTIDLTMKCIASDLHALCEACNVQNNELVRSDSSGSGPSVLLNPDQKFPLMSEHFDSLTSNINHLRRLMQQCPASDTGAGKCDRPSVQAKVKVSWFNRVQVAAENLYRALGLACSKHVRHEVHLMLQAISEDPAQVLFRLILPTSKARASRRRPESLRFTIESRYLSSGSQPYPTEQQVDISSDLAIRHKRSREDDTGQTRPAETKFTRQDRETSFITSYMSTTANDQLNCDNIGAAQARRSLSSKAVSFMDDEVVLESASTDCHNDVLPNFCMKRNFCNHIDSIITPNVAQHHALGYFAPEGCTKHLVYLDHSTATTNDESNNGSGGRPTKLKDFLSSQMLTQSKIASISRQLATAVLQYHTTLWLETWDVDHVLIADSITSHVANEYAVSPSIESYVNVSINRTLKDGSHVAAASRSKTLIPNWTLLRLGVMLLELAYQRPLREMREPDDLYPNEHDTDFYTARRLSCDVSSKMGNRFARVVKRCISCNFGHEEDLSNTDLQAAFYQYVVQELEIIETKLKGLD